MEAALLAENRLEAQIAGIFDEGNRTFVWQRCLLLLSWCLQSACFQIKFFGFGSTLEMVEIIMFFITYLLYVVFAPTQTVF